MARNILFTAGVVLVVLSLFLPWFVTNQTNETTVHDNLYETGTPITESTETSFKYSLDHSVVEVKTETTKGSNTNNSYSGSNDHYEEQLVGLSPWGGELSNIQSFLYTLYKIVMVVLLLSFTVIVLEGLNPDADLSSMKMGIVLLYLVVILVYLGGIRGAIYEDQGSETVLESPNSNEYVNMSLPIGFGKSLVSNDTYLEYYILANDTSFGFEKTIVDTGTYDSTSSGDHFRVYTGPGPDEIDWDKNNWNHTFQYENETVYYIWFDKEPLDNNVSERDPTPESTEEDPTVSMRIDISDLSENEDSDVVIRNRIVQAFDASTAPFSATANQTDMNRLYIESTNYGNQRDSTGWDMSWPWQVSNDKHGYLDYTESEGDSKLGASWYPSTGFVISLIGLACFVGSRFED